MDTIGSQFAAERKKRGLDFSDVEHAIGIRALYIQALEEGRYEVLPGEVYVKGFIRNYGNFLGLDGAQLVQEYSAAKMPDEQPPKIQQHAPTGTASTPSMNRKKTVIMLVVVLILVLSGGGLYIWQKGKSVPVARQTPPAQTQQPALPIPAQNSPVLPPASPSTLVPSTLTSAKAVVITARFTDRCWTSAIADGKTIYEGIPKNGDTLTWEADRQIVVNLGNAAAVEISLNGKPQGKMGEKGDVVVKTFTATMTPAINTPPAAPSKVSPNPSQPVRP